MNTFLHLHYTKFQQFCQVIFEKMYNILCIILYYTLYVVVSCDSELVPEW